MECKKGMVNVYDSLFTTLDKETLDTINNCFGETNAKRKVQYKMVQVQTQQVDSSLSKNQALIS